MMPYFSIIMATLNRGYCIERAIKSIVSQTLSDWELIIIDDGGSDDTHMRVKQFNEERIQFFRLDTNQGVNAARNHGIQHAHGEWLIILDSDDEIVPEALEVFKKTIDGMSETERAGVGVIYAGVIDADTHKPQSHVVGSRRICSYEDILGGKGISGEFIPAVKKQVFTEFSYRDEVMAFENMFWSTVAKKYSFLAIEAPLRLYHQSGTDRYAQTLIAPKHAAQRFSDYKTFLHMFGPDLERFNHNRYAHYLMMTGFFAGLCGKTKESRAYLFASWRAHKKIPTALLIAASHCGQYPFLMAAKAAAAMI